MTRVYSHRSQQGAHGASALDRLRANRKKKPYKILLEAVTQEKKKLHSILTYTANAPPGYWFVPAGHPDLTEFCKEQCRKQNLDVHIVSAKPRSKAHENPEKISHHVHRIGYHFPNEVIGAACDVLGYRYRNGIFHKMTRQYGQDDTRLARSLATHGQRMLLHGRPATEKESKTQVRDAVRDMFPKIPESDLTAIVHHAFEKGSKRVGNATELTLARRVQLAVVAHIRHTYTEYDSLLKTGSWSEARSKVEHVSLAKLREWRDEADNDELEETFREVIIIDDDDDDSSDDEDSFSEIDQREQSLEIVSSRATARELQHNELDDVLRIDSHSVARAPRRTILVPVQPNFRSSAILGTSNTYSNEQAPRAHARPLPSAAPMRSIQQFHPPRYLAHSRSVDPRSRTSVFEPVPMPQRPLQMRGEDGQLYNLQPIEEPSINKKMKGGNSLGGGVQYVSSPGRGYVQSSQRVNSLDSNHSSRYAPPIPSRRASEQDVVLPSIEREPESIPPRHITDSPRQLQQDYGPIQVRYRGATHNEAQLPKRKELNPPGVSDRAHGYHEQVVKRPRHVGREVEIVAPLPASLPASGNHEDVQSRPRVQAPYYEVLDLTSSSPIQPPYNRNVDGHVVPMRPYTTRVDNYSHTPVQSRGPYYEKPTMEPSRFDVPTHHRMMEGYPPLREYPPVREQPRHPQVAVGGRATRSGLVYGGYELH